MHRVFISFHHGKDRGYKDLLTAWNKREPVFIDLSVDTEDISDELSDEQVRVKIRDEYLMDSTVTILLAGVETSTRKHVDWELYSSMFDGAINKKSGIIVVLLPTTGCFRATVSHKGEKEDLFSEVEAWIEIRDRIGFEELYPFLPARIIDNLIAKSVQITVVPWSKMFGYPAMLSRLIENAFNDRESCEYDLSRPMRRANS